MTIKSTISSVLLGAVVLSGPFVSGCKESPADARVKKEYQEALDATKEWTEAKYESFRETAKDRQREFRSELAALEEKLAEAGDKVSEETKEARDAVKARLDELGRRLDSAAAATAEDRAKASEKIGEALDSVGAALTKAKEAFTDGDKQN